MIGKPNGICQKCNIIANLGERHFFSAAEMAASGPLPKRSK